MTSPDPLSNVAEELRARAEGAEGRSLRITLVSRTDEHGQTQWAIEPADAEADALHLAKVDHDLRSPLLTLGLMGKLLTQGLDPDESSSDLGGLVTDATTKLGTLTRDLLTFVRARLGAHSPD